MSSWLSSVPQALVRAWYPIFVSSRQPKRLPCSAVSTARQQEDRLRVWGRPVLQERVQVSPTPLRLSKTEGSSFRSPQASASTLPSQI